MHIIRNSCRHRLFPIVALLISLSSIAVTNGQAKKCQLPAVSNGHLTILGTQFPNNTVLSRTYIVVTCNPGFFIKEGVSVSLCDDTGQWTGAIGSCSPNQTDADCTRNLKIDNGRLINTGNIGNYRIDCQPGFVISGAANVYCFDERSWTYPGSCKKQSDSSPSLIRQCAMPVMTTGMVSVNGGAFFFPYQFMVPSGTRVTITCSAGFMPRASPDALCVGDEIWLPQPLGCIRVPLPTTAMPTTTTKPPTTQPGLVQGYLAQVRCELPKTPNSRFYVNGQFADGTFAEPGDVAALQCLDLYHLQGGFASSTCQIDGTWSRPFGLCLLNKLTGGPTPKCIVLNTLNGSILFNGNRPTPSDIYQVFPGTKLMIQCDQGFQVVAGASETFCLSSGYLQDALGRCGLPTTTTTTTTTTSAPVTAQLSNNQQLPVPVEPEGLNAIIWCKVPQSQYGTISLDKPPRTRELTPALHNIVVGTRISLRCYIGYYVANGVNTAVCQGNGRLSDQLGECVPISSSAPSPADWSSSLMGEPVARVSQELYAPVPPSPTSTTTTTQPDSSSEEPVNSDELLNVAITGDANSARALLAKGAAVDSRDGDNRTALMWAARFGNYEVVKVLIEAGAQVNAIDNVGYTALMFAAQYGRLEIAKMLLAAKANVNYKFGASTALILATQNGFPSTVQLLLQKKAYVDDFDATGSTALIWAARKGSAVLVDTLLKSGANVNAADFDGMTALMWASRYGYADVVARLLESRADVAVRDARGMTATRWADLNGRYNIIQLLMRYQEDMYNRQGHLDYNDRIYGR